jgi:hypothetical protein
MVRQAGRCAAVGVVTFIDVLAVCFLGVVAVAIEVYGAVHVPFAGS